MKYFSIALLFLGVTLFAQESTTEINTSLVSGLKFRNIGPAFSSGRIADIALDPCNDNVWYVAVGSGSVWKTNNAGTTWSTIFDDQPSYSIGCITVDPSNPNIVWVGTGENVGGRHVAYGDGVYRSMDGGKSWKNMGLKKSEHLSEIIVHPKNSDIVWVASQGPLWTSGGERGLYKTTDGGENWELVLSDNEWTGVTDIALDPLNPDVMYAATWQRHRTIAALMGGGPGSGIHKSTDGGQSWTKLKKGLPGSNLGKIGLAISPFDSDIIYAAVETDRRTGGVYISKDRGASWAKQSNAVSGATGPHYYQELYASPHHEGTLYLVDVRTQVSDDHGKTFRQLKEENKHSDNHSIAFREDDPNYILMGTDGGIYETFDLAENWRYIENMPITQYYKLAVDDALPFYNVFGGTQDNGTHAGPSRTFNYEGIRNADWAHILGGDGHQTATEPGNPDIVYGESQQGYLNRIDRITGETVFIQPQAGKDEPHERFAWDTPILVSAHDPARIYTASYRVWRSENRGDSWKTVSGDLTKGLERIEQPIMGRKQSWDNPWDIYAMSNFSTITSLGESPVQDGILYAGTDDGLIHVTKDGGENWKKIEVGSIKGIPANAFVNDIRADLYDANTVYAALDNHKYGDFKPYIIKSTDAGNSWKIISGNINERSLVYRLVQDHERRELLFAATEFGIWFTIDGGEKWVQMKGGLPTIAFRDIQIQRRESDLVGASFGRGFYILDDLSPLRELSAEMLKEDAKLFPVKDALQFAMKAVTVDPGASEYRAENPPYGAVITYFMKDGLSSLKADRKKKEKELNKTNSDIPFPGWEAIEKENNEDAPFVLVTITDKAGKVVNHVRASASAGIHRVTWGLTELAGRGMDLDQGVSSSSGRGRRGGGGTMVNPGTYSATLFAVEKGNVTKLTDPVSFEVKKLMDGALTPVSDDVKATHKAALEEFGLEYSTVSKALSKAENHISVMKQACYQLDSDASDLIEQVYAAEERLTKLGYRMNGMPAKDEVGAKQAPTPGERYGTARRGLYSSYGPTEMHRESLKVAKEELAPIKSELKDFVDNTLPALKSDLEKAGAPFIEEL